VDYGDNPVIPGKLRYIEHGQDASTHHYNRSARMRGAEMARAPPSSSISTSEAGALLFVAAVPLANGSGLFSQLLKQPPIRLEKLALGYRDHICLPALLEQTPQRPTPMLKIDIKKMQMCGKVILTGEDHTFLTESSNQIRTATDIETHFRPYSDTFTYTYTTDFEIESHLGVVTLTANNTTGIPVPELILYLPSTFELEGVAHAVSSGTRIHKLKDIPAGVKVTNFQFKFHKIEQGRYRN
jgi:hypothetical protein